MFDAREFTRSYDGASNMSGRYNGIQALIYQDHRWHITLIAQLIE